jgi:hypothetical protein
MGINVDVMTYLAALHRGYGVLEAQYVAPMFAEGLALEMWRTRQTANALASGFFQGEG